MVCKAVSCYPEPQRFFDCETLLCHDRHGLCELAQEMEINCLTAEGEFDYDNSMNGDAKKAALAKLRRKMELRRNIRRRTYLTAVLDAIGRP
eukprot:6572663-Pyramimonas_sp.AAC.1